MISQYFDCLNPVLKEMTHQCNRRKFDNLHHATAAHPAVLPLGCYGYEHEEPLQSSGNYIFRATFALWNMDAFANASFAWLKYRIPSRCVWLIAQKICATVASLSFGGQPIWCLKGILAKPYRAWEASFHFGFRFVLFFGSVCFGSSVELFHPFRHLCENFNLG